MKPQKERIEEIRTNGYELDFGTVFEQAFENYKKIAIYAGSMLLVFAIIFGILLCAIAVSIFDIASVAKALKPENLQPEKFTGIFLIIYTSCMILLACLISPFQAGFFKMSDCAEKGEEFHISTMFEFYKSPYIINIIGATLIISLISTGISLSCKLVGMEAVGLFTSFAISLVTVLTIPLIVFAKLNAVQAIQTSIMIVLKQPFIILGLLIIAIIGAGTLGFICLLIGIFFTIPFVYSMQYSIYKSIVGIDFTNEIKN